jgi:hypothetical protein
MGTLELSEAAHAGKLKSSFKNSDLEARQPKTEAAKSKKFAVKVA